ncbi:MAG: carboxypeptidase-like regulatory domain-containing protein, partial [Parabacteroides sp.]|nr:carboxypeptidase-like regulatory domain-containing protein [Parabacteroides sp.]
QLNVTTSQPIQVKGSILDNKGEPIIGASILEKGTTNGTITDIDGNFFLNVSSNQSTLVISYVGYKTQEIIANKANIQITLHEDSEALEEVVVIGYGTQSKAKVTGSISKIEGSKLIGSLTVSSFDQALAPKLPGVNIQQATGAPGAGVNIKIRSTSSINFGGHPLIVVDGLPLSNSSFDETLQGKPTIAGFQSSYAIDPLSSINPSDIASIDVLKDAASTAIYGSRGSNGVIMITTKKGKEGKPVVNFNMYAGAQKLSKKVDVMDAYQLAQYTNLSRDEAWVAVGGNANDPLSIRTGANYTYPDYMIPYLEGKQGLTNTD